MESKIRAVDWLGRFVIPKEFREKLHLKEDDKVEIFLNENNEIIVRPYVGDEV
jgi:AbrB family looped-hinge helix DNA binding protein